MKANALSTRQIRVEETPRAIVQRTRGLTHGAITRLVSAGDIGELIKPFVFLDYFEADPANAPKFGFHPHSGIATLTLILSGQAFYKETTDREGIIETGGVEWMRASSGVWHTGGVFGKERIRGFQLWIALPPALELAEPQSQYLNASDFQCRTRVRGRRKQWRGGRACQRGKLYVGFAWNLRVMTYTSDVSVRDTV
jgi:redox-sensitive bicupin YhaK (pirin superfamily)